MRSGEAIAFGAPNSDLAQRPEAFPAGSSAASANSEIGRPGYGQTHRSAPTGALVFQVPYCLSDHCSLDKVTSQLHTFSLVSNH